MGTKASVSCSTFEKLVHFDKEDPSIVTPQLARVGYGWMTRWSSPCGRRLKPQWAAHDSPRHQVWHGRAMNPATGSGAFFTMLATIDSIDAIDDYTLRITG